MPYTTNVAGTTITAAYGNSNIRDQVVTPFATAAARASAITSPVQGMLSYRNDLGQDGGFEHWNGTGWVPAAAQKIFTSTLGSAVATVAINTIPQVYGTLVLMGNGAASPASFNVDCLIQVSGDGGTNYSMFTWDTSQASANPLGAFTSANTSLIWGFALPGSSYGATRAGAWSVSWPGYATTTLSKASLHDMWLTDGGTSYNTHHRGGFWKNASAVTSLLLTCGGSGNFNIGSYFALWGLP